jgi:hypothetical protein
VVSLHYLAAKGTSDNSISFRCDLELLLSHVAATAYTHIRRHIDFVADVGEFVTRQLT